MNILLADGDEVTNLGLSTFIKKKYKLISVVSSTEMFDQLSQNEFDILLIDYSSTNFSFDDLKKLAPLKNNMRIVAICSDQLASTMAKAIQIGVQSHLKKTCGFEEIIECLESTLAGQNFICGEILEDFKLQSIELSSVLSNESINCAGVKMSIREIEIIKLIAEGNSAKQVAEQLYLSNHTINTHRKNIFNKLQINSTTGLVIYAVKSGIVDVDQFQFSNLA